MSDKRRHKRVPLASIVKLSIEDEGTVHTFETLTVDISMSGICVYSESTVDIDKDVSLTIEFPGNDGLPRTDSIRGHVVYNNILGTKYFIGIEFSEQITPFRQPFLFERLQRILAWN